MTINSSPVLTGESAKAFIEEAERNDKLPTPTQTPEREAQLREMDRRSRELFDFLEEHQSETPSRFVEEATWRKENATWLRWSRKLAITLIAYMQDNGLKRADLAGRLGVSPQYVSKLLSGNENLSFKNVANIEDKLGISCLTMV